MSESRSVILSRAGKQVTLEVIVTHQKPASISVALYGEDHHKVKDLGSALTLEPPDPDIFVIAEPSAIDELDKKVVGVFVTITSFSTTPEESVSVIASLRQGGVPVADGLIVVKGIIKDSGAGVVLGYKLSVK